MKEEINKIDWQAALDGTRPVTTRDGKKVTLYCVDAPTPRPIHGFVVGRAVPDTWRKDGSFLSYKESPLDLIQPLAAPKPFKHEFWVNVYPLGVSETYEKREIADTWATQKRVACVRFVVEGHEGDGL